MFYADNNIYNIWNWMLRGAVISLFFFSSSTILKPPQRPLQFHSAGIHQPELEAYSHLHSVPKLRIVGAFSLLPLSLHACSITQSWKFPLFMNTEILMFENVSHSPLLWTRQIHATDTLAPFTNKQSISVEQGLTVAELRRAFYYLRFR